jgi:hypothetical protein
MNSYAEVMDITPKPGNDTSYTIDLKRDWCIGQGTCLLISHSHSLLLG